MPHYDQSTISRHYCTIPAVTAEVGDISANRSLVTSTNPSHLFYSEVHQMFGRYYGILQADNNEDIQLDGLIGFTEEHHARW
ncbi:MAG: DUF2804 family protein [Anaerolineae bacterium]|nr:DUF2804 family protein [Anaerolineae bacterium]